MGLGLETRRFQSFGLTKLNLYKSPTPCTSTSTYLPQNLETPASSPVMVKDVPPGEHPTSTGLQPSTVSLDLRPKCQTEVLTWLLWCLGFRI
jgi:hypothetical protein